MALTLNPIALGAAAPIAKTDKPGQPADAANTPKPVADRVEAPKPVVDVVEAPKPVVDVVEPAATAAPQQADKPAMLKPPTPFDRKVIGYTGPEDGLSHPKYKRILVPIVQALVAGRYRKEIEGGQHLKRPGAQMFCPTHPSAFDPGVVVALMGQRDVRYMSNMQMFRGIMGPLFTAIGAFPVDREGASRVTLKHCNDLLGQGTSLCVFPEGTLTGLAGQVGPIKKGAPSAAITGGAESLIPIAINYEPDTKSRPVEAMLGGLAACAVAAGGILAATHGGPSVQLAASMLGAATFGAYLTRNVVRKFVPEGGPQLQEAPKYLAGVAAGLVGATLGATAVAVGSHFSPASLPAIATSAGLLGGAATFGWSTIFRHRDVARIIVCDPILIAPYMENKIRHEAVIDLTNELHRSLGHAKEKLTGVPYDDTAPKIGGKVVDGLKGQPLLGKGEGLSFTSSATGHKRA